MFLLQRLSKENKYTMMKLSFLFNIHYLSKCEKYELSLHIKKQY